MGETNFTPEEVAKFEDAADKRMSEKDKQLSDELKKAVELYRALNQDAEEEIPISGESVKRLMTLSELKDHAQESGVSHLSEDEINQDFIDTCQQTMDSLKDSTNAIDEYVRYSNYEAIENVRSGGREALARGIGSLLNKNVEAIIRIREDFDSSSPGDQADLAEEVKWGCQNVVDLEYLRSLETETKL